MDSAVERDHVSVARFGAVAIDFDAVRITRDGTHIPAEPQVLDVLEYLIRHRERVVSKEELLDNVWGDRFVSESALTTRIKTARRCAGDDGKTQAVIRTVHGRGYQFVADLLGDDASESADRPPGDDASDSRPSAAAKRPATTVDRIAPPTSETFGRDALLDTFADRVAVGRVLTLVGPGGVGKTHLARRGAGHVSDRFPDGSWLVPLAYVRDSTSTGMAVLDALDEPQFLNATPEETLLETLRSRAGLLVLDNCEHVLDTIAQLVTDLLAAAPSMTIVATSQRRLGVPGELVLDVPTLDSESASELFATRAAERGGTAESASTIVREICQQLDNLPLAIELASAHSRVLDPQQLSDLLDERLSLLTDASVGDVHHATLEQVIATSFEALEQPVQETLCRLSVMSGPFGLTQATRLARSGRDITQVEAVQQLIELAERSLVVVETGEHEARYRLLESVRLFCAQRLADPAHTKSVHIEIYRDRAVQSFEALNGPHLAEEFGRVMTDWGNYRSALAYALELDMLGEAAQMLAAIEDFAAATQRYEHSDWAERLLAAGNDDDTRLVSVRAGLSRFMVFKDFSRVLELIESVPDPLQYFGSLDAAAYFHLLGSDHDRGDAMLQAMLDMSEGTGGLRELYATGTAVFLRSTSAGKDMRSPFERVKVLGPSHGTIGAAFVALAAARCAFAAGDSAETIRQCGTTLELAEQHGLGILVIGAARARSMGLATHDDLPFVAEQLIDSLSRYRSRGHWTASTIEATLAARIFLESGEVETAARLLGAWSAAGFARNWSAEVAGPMVELIEQEHPDQLAAFEAGGQLQGAALCDYMLNVLAEHLAAASS